MAQEIFLDRELQDPNVYTKFSKDQVSNALSEFGYGPTKKLVDSLYIHPDTNVGVGVLTITKEHCRDHFGIFRGFDQAEAIGQTGLLIAKFSGKIPSGHHPLLTSTEGFDWDLPVVEGAILNLIVQPQDLESAEFKVEGQVVIGKVVVAHGKVAGTIAKQMAVDVLIARRRQIQARTEPLFPPVD